MRQKISLPMPDMKRGLSQGYFIWQIDERKYKTYFDPTARGKHVTNQPKAASLMSEG